MITIVQAVAAASTTLDESEFAEIVEQTASYQPYAIAAATGLLKGEEIIFYYHEARATGNSDEAAWNYAFAHALAKK